jgi:acyl-CoA synthetase (NDP forming)
VTTQVEGRVEAIVGVVSDPDLGAAEMIDRLRMRPLLDGYRSSPPADRAALVELVERVSALADVAPEIRELDLNPVEVLGASEGVTVVDARILAAS